MKTISNILSSIITAGLGCGLAAAGMAQGVLEEIIVTAQKREESLQDLAASITAFNSAAIEERRLGDMANLAMATPGVSYRENANSAQVSIRGVGLLVVNGVAEANVATHVDGVFQPRTSASTLQMEDMERIEILRGPQGTLYGRNATGGTINYVSAKPTDEFEGSVTAGFGDYDWKKFSGYVSGPLIDDSVSGRLSAYYDERDGYYDNIFLDRDTFGSESKGVRGAISWTPTDNLSVDLSARHDEQENDGGAVQALLRGTNPIVDGLEASGQIPVGSVIQDLDSHETAAELFGSSEKETNAFVAEINYDLNDNISIKSLTGYTDHEFEDLIDGDGTNLGIVNVGNASKNERRHAESQAFSQEFNFSGATFDDRLNWLVGLYYFTEDHDFMSPIEFPDPAVQVILGQGVALLSQEQGPFEEETESKAVFADVTYAMTDDVRLGLGVRYTEDTKDFTQTSMVELDLGVPITVVSCEDLEINQEFDHTNYRVRAEWDVANDAMVYAQWQDGFKDGGLNVSVCNDTFPEEEIDAWEVGAKTSWLEGKLVLNLSAFYYGYDNLQILKFENAVDIAVEPVPESTIQGAEIELLAGIADNWVLDVGVALLDAEIDEFEAFDASNPQLGVQDLSGNGLPQTPDHTINVGLEYGLDTDIGSFQLRGEVFYSDSFNFSTFDNSYEAQDDYTVLNLYANYTNPSDSYMLRAFVRNATDEEYYNFLINAATTGVAGDYAPPRTYGVELNYRF